MQEVRWIQGHYLYDINVMLKDGWRVKAIYPAAGRDYDTKGAFILLEKEND